MYEYCIVICTLDIENRTVKITMINIKLKINSVKIEVRVTYALTIQSKFY